MIHPGLGRGRGRARAVCGDMDDASSDTGHRASPASGTPVGGLLSRALGAARRHEYLPAVLDALLRPTDHMNHMSLSAVESAEVAHPPLMAGSGIGIHSASGGHDHTPDDELVSLRLSRRNRKVRTMEARPSKAPPVASSAANLVAKAKAPTLATAATASVKKMRTTEARPSMAPHIVYSVANQSANSDATVPTSVSLSRPATEVAADHDESEESETEIVCFPKGVGSMPSSSSAGPDQSDEADSEFGFDPAGLGIVQAPASDRNRTPSKTRACAKMLVRSGLRCSCCYELRALCQKNHCLHSSFLEVLSQLRVVSTVSLLSLLSPLRSAWRQVPAPAQARTFFSRTCQ